MSVGTMVNPEVVVSAPPVIEYATALPLAPDPRKPERMPYGDAIRIWGTIAVIIGHVCDMSLYQLKPLSHDWQILNFVDAAMRWAVPAYIMLSGSLLLDPARAEPPSRFYKKRLIRIGIPLLFWTPFFLLFAVYFTGWRKWPDAIHDLLEGKPYMHLHFIFRIAGLYAFTPMFRIFLRHISRQMLIGTVILVLALSSLDSIMNCITGTEFSAFARFGPFVGYYLAGYAMREMYLSREKLIWCWVGFIASIVLLALGTDWTIHLFHKAGNISGPPSLELMFYDFLSPIRVAMAIFGWLCLINLFRSEHPHGTVRRTIVRYWASATLGIYLIHPAFREILYLKGIWPFSTHGISATTFSSIWIGIPVTALLVYLPAVVVTVIIERIPYVRRIVG